MRFPFVLAAALTVAGLATAPVHSLARPGAGRHDESTSSSAGSRDPTG